MEFVTSLVEVADGNYDSDDEDALPQDTEASKSDVEEEDEQQMKDGRKQTSSNNGQDSHNTDTSASSAAVNSSSNATISIAGASSGSNKQQTKLKRRMSSMFPMKFNLRKENDLDPAVKDKLQELYEKFPNPPDHMNFPQVFLI